MLLDEQLAAAILAPLSGPSPCGIDARLLEDGPARETFQELRQQRKAAFTAERAAAVEEDEAIAASITARWADLAEASSGYLVSHAKDLEPMTILIEASVRLAGLAGLERSMVLLADLVESFWEQGLLPGEDEDGVEARFWPLSSLSGGSNDNEGTLILPLRRVVLLRSSGNELSYGRKVHADTRFAAAQASSSDEQRAQLRRFAQEAFDQFSATAAQTPVAQLRQVIDQLTAAEAGWRRAIAFISERTKPRFPATSRVSDELRNMRDWIEGLARDRLAASTAGEAHAMPDVSKDHAALPPVAPGVQDKISHRSDALRMVLAAADFFDHAEPLSPIGPALRDINRRARLSFAELVAELLPDPGSRNDYYLRSGIKPPEV